MQRRTFLLAAAALLATACGADARMHAPYRGHRITQASAPLDGFTQPAAAYSFRKLRSAYAGQAVRLRRTTGGEQDIGFVGFVPGLGSPWDVAAAASFCAATTCFVVTLYDQSGNGRDLTDAPAAQPALVFNCLGVNACQRSAATGVRLILAGVATSATGSYSAVVKRTGNGVAYPIVVIGAANHGILANGGAAVWGVFGNSGQAQRNAPDGAWHAAVGVINGAASVLNVDGTDGTAASVTNSADSGLLLSPAGDAAGALDAVESIMWQGYVLTAGERAALAQNQRSYWGF